MPLTASSSAPVPVGPLAAALAPTPRGLVPGDGPGERGGPGNGPSGGGAPSSGPGRAGGPTDGGPRDGKVAITLELAKPRITKLVTLTSAVGFGLGLAGMSFTGVGFAISAVGCIAGTALSAAGANALNQWWERHRDGLMERTASRPLPTRRTTAAEAFWIGAGLALAGLVILALACGVAAAAVSAATVLIYVLVYTPMKPVSPWATLVGAVPGALPPLIGWCAARHMAGDAAGLGTWGALLEAGGWTLFALMMVWQIPHFLAIAWMYKDDYARGGHAVLPVFDPTGSKTAWTVVIGAVALIPATLAPALFMPGKLGLPYGVVAVLTGLGFLVLCGRLLRQRTREQARTVFIASVIHLPVLLLVMVAEVSVRAAL
jgi:heme o synthase